MILLGSLSAIALTASPFFLPSDEGCTPGYWKTHPERWDGVGSDDFTQSVVTSLSFNAVFGVSSSDSGVQDSITLIEAADLGGGGVIALNRHAVAALASADSVCYPLTVGQVIDAYRGAVLGTGGIESTKNLLESYNEAGCPLSNSTPPPPEIIFCVADEGDCPCGNESLFGGCENSSGFGASIGAAGTTSVAADDLLLITTQLPANATTLFLMANTLRRQVFMDGLLCIGGPMSKIFRLPPAMSSGPDGTATFGPGLVALSQTPLVPVPGGILAGDTWYFQTFFRDSGPCGTGSNTSNVVAVTFTP